MTKNKTWTADKRPITLPLQAKRGSSKTVIGAIGGDPFRFLWIVTNRTNQFTVLEFLRYFVSQNQNRLSDTVMYTDNCGSHKARLVQAFLRESNVTMEFMPAYSSTLSPIERTWGVFKA